MDDGKSVTFDINEMQHFDHGYAVTSHSSQGLIADRVLVNIDTNVHPELIKTDEFYVNYLGFHVDWDHRFDNEAPIYQQISRG